METVDKCYNCKRPLKEEQEELCDWCSKEAEQYSDDYEHTQKIRRKKKKYEV